MNGEPSGRYPPIAELAFLSDAHTAALVGPDASVEWLCAPRFDAPSVFARLLDRDHGGSFDLAVEGGGDPERTYLDRSLVLESRWDGPDGTVSAHDFLAVRATPGVALGGIDRLGILVRLVRCTSGRARVTARVEARPGYAEREGRWSGEGDVLVEEDAGLWLCGEPALVLDGEGRPALEAELSAGEAAVLALGYRGMPRRVDRPTAERMLDETAEAWRGWSARSSYDGTAAAEVEHGARVLRGLLFDETGALLAAPTTSLPEWIGGPRNWDYRFTWHRDAALVVLVLLRLGHDEEAGAYLRFLIDHCAQCHGRLEPMLAIDGGTELTEETLDHLEGYERSAPVRVGNEARGQEQLDSYGHVLDAALAYHEVTGRLTPADLAELWRVARMTCEIWREPDSGIWEVRGEQRHWTNSKLMAWVCLDRAVRLAEMTRDTTADVAAWRDERETIRTDVLEHGYDEDLGAFVQAYGSQALDASLLRIPMLGFLSGDDPRVVSTIERIDERLGEADVLIHRYDAEETGDGLDSPEGAFLLCSFDMVSALVLAGRVEEARRRFDELCSRAGELGLFSEEMARDGRMLGNHPQAFTHLAMIDAAMNLDQAGRKDALHAWADSRAEEAVPPRS